MQGQIAAASADFDTALRLLIPLQAEKNLLPQAYASLHATLARAYEQQENPLRALEQYVKAADFQEAAAGGSLQANIWRLVSKQSKEVLLEMRGEGSDTTVQGWIDLALAASYTERRERNIEQWRSAYPQHPASADLLASILASATAATAKSSDNTINGKIALLLPLDSTVYGSAAQAIQAGFMAGLTGDNTGNANKPNVQVYPTGDAEQTRQAYVNAVNDGASWVVGPLTRDEVSALVAGSISIPTLALNQPDGEFKPQQHLILFGLSAEAEARQIAQMVRERGLQTAQVVVANTPLGKRIAKAFTDEWVSLQGSVTAELTIPEQSKLAELKTASNANTADMIFLAANAAQAKLARPYLDAATPTYGTSHLYDGVQKGLQNLDLVAVHFVDMPWILETEETQFSGYRVAAAAFKGVELQRLFALGLDAYRLLPQLQGQIEGKTLLEGASGEILYGEPALSRTLPMAQFRRDGVALEDAP